MPSDTAMGSYSNNSPIYLAPVSILCAIALCLVVLRIYTRATRRRQLFLDDWLIIVAEPLSLTSFILAVTAISHGWGKPITYVTPAQLKTILKLEFAMQAVWIFTLCLVRLSVAASLLRFCSDRWWRWTLYFLMIAQCFISTSWVVIQFGQCTPYSTTWDFVPDVKCWPRAPIVSWGWGSGVMYIAMDLALAIMPIKLVRSLSRPKAEKILISVLMSLGLLATAISCVKMTTLSSFGHGDVLQATMTPSTYAKIEEVVGIIACSLPCMKAPAEQLLRKLGILDELRITRPSFVDSTDASTRPGDLEEVFRNDSTVSHTIAKDTIRIDSVAMKPGSSGSAPLH